MASKKNPANKAAAAGAVAAAAGRAATPKPKPAAAGPPKGRTSPTVTSHPATATAPGAPTTPNAVTPFFTADDLDSINAFNTDLAEKLQSIDTNLANLQTDTTYQETQNNTAAKANTGAAQDDAAARGIFQSSIKDATLYDIEAQRSLSQKFLEDKLTTARLDAGTQKQNLGISKTNFDTNMLSREASNAQGVNDSNNSAYAAALAAWQTAHPGATVASATAAPGAAPAGSAASAGPPRKGVPRPLNAPSIAAGRDSHGNLLPGTSVKTNKKNKTQTYYGGVTTA